MVPENEPEVGSTTSARLVVGPADLASSLVLEANDNFPEVLATARMIALMEVAGSRALQGLLKEGELSVGVTVDVSHTAPTPIGTEVVAQARYLGKEGKLYLFEVSAYDAGGEIGKGFHKRAIVARDRLERGALKRIASSE